ncbi:uncharacterized protein phf11 [Salminus brasiliensis]|uniref:uncharacterized protein phf11 n=1 Tax=Salminus brasiliensis TaxID=930266 RepID=UPI003B8388A2
MEQDEDSSPAGVVCLLCKTDDETETTGPLLSKEDISAHHKCLIYSSGIFCRNSPSFDDLFGFDVKDVKKEYNRGKKLKCHLCKQKGATVGCEVKKCKRSYHYPCAVKDRARCLEKKSKGRFMVFCEVHDPKRHRNSDWANESHCSTAGSNSSPTKRLRLDDSRGETSSESDSSATLRHKDKKKRRTSGEHSGMDLLLGPIEISDTEEVPPPVKYRQSSPVPKDKRNKDREGSSPPTPDVSFLGADGDDTDIEDVQACKDNPPGGRKQSQSLLEKEYQHDNVSFTVIMDSGPFSESENSWSTSSPSLLPGQATTAATPEGLVNPHESLSAPEQAASVHTPTITAPVISPPVPDCPSIDSPLLKGDGAAEPRESPKCSSPTALSVECGVSDHDEPPERPSRNTPPLHMPESHAPPTDRPLDLTSPPRGSSASPRLAEGIEQASVSETNATLFWMRCNEVGCTEAIFSELTRQISSLAERVQAQHATQQDYAVSHRILQASGKLPAIFQQLEQDFEERERELQKKREALRNARALLNYPN